MTRREEIEDAAKGLFKDSEYPVPNMYSFIKGAEWADKNPSPQWHKFANSDCKPEKGQVIIIATIDMEFKVASYELARYDPMSHCHIKDDNVRWLAVPEL